MPMVALNNFSSYELSTIMRLEGGPLRPTRVQLQALDRSLEDEYGQRLATIMTEEGIARTKPNRSRVLLYSKLMAGSSAAAKIRRACRYFKHLNQL